MDKLHQPGNIVSISRVRRSHQDAHEAYDRMSSWYDLLTASEQKFTRLALDLLAVQQGDRMLDLGCGTGSALTYLSTSTEKKAKIIGSDLSHSMLAKAQSKLTLMGTLDTVSLMGADLTNLPIQSASINAILMSFTLELFDTPEIPLVLAECRRVLKSGGRMAVVSLAKTVPPGWMERTYEWFHKHFEQFADCRPIYTSQSLIEAGFTIIKAYRKSMWRLPVDVLLASR